MRRSLWFLGLVTTPLIVGGCAGHNHHWQRTGTSAHDTEHAIEDCEAATGGGEADVDACMREQGFEWEGHSHGSRQHPDGPALGAIPRLPGY